MCRFIAHEPWRDKGFSCPKIQANTQRCICKQRKQKSQQGKRACIIWKPRSNTSRAELRLDQVPDCWLVRAQIVGLHTSYISTCSSWTRVMDWFSTGCTTGMRLFLRNASTFQRKRKGILSSLNLRGHRARAGPADTHISSNLFFLRQLKMLWLASFVLAKTKPSQCIISEHLKTRKSFHFDENLW